MILSLESAMERRLAKVEKALKDNKRETVYLVINKRDSNDILTKIKIG